MNVFETANSIYPFVRIVPFFIFALALIILAWPKIKKIRGILPKSASAVKFALKGREEGIIFGIKYWLVAHSKTNDEGHVGVFGGSGLGKTRNVLIPTLRNWQGTSLVIDISGDIVRAVNCVRKLVFAPYENNCVPYNVLAEADFATDYREKCEALDRIVDAIMPEREFTSDSGDFFYHSGKKMVRAAFRTYYFQGCDFTSICKRILSRTPEMLFSEVRSSMRAEDINELASMQRIKETTLGSCKDRADDAVRPFTNPRLTEALRRPAMPEELYIAPQKLENWNVFLVIPDYTLTAMGPVLKLIAGQCFQYVSMRKDYSLPKILFCLDEFSSLGFLDILGPLDKFRKKGARIMILAQSVLQIDMIYGTTTRRSMMENLKYQIYLGVNDAALQRELADKFGKEVNDDGIIDYKMRPEEFARLRDKLVLVSPDGLEILKKYGV